MSVPQYTAGAWTAVVRPGFVALVGPDADAALARALWDAAPEGVVAVLDVLARDGLAALPHFAVAAVDGTRVHVALRGDVDVEVTETDGAQQVLRAGGVRTWSEQVLETVGVLVARVGAATGDAVPLVDGVAPAGSVRVEVAEVVVVEPEPEPEPAAEPGTEVEPVAAPVSAAPASTKRGGSKRVAAAPAQTEPAPVEGSAPVGPADEPVDEPVAETPTETPAETPAVRDGVASAAQATPAPVTPAQEASTTPDATASPAVDEPRAEVADVATPETSASDAAPDTAAVADESTTASLSAASSADREAPELPTARGRRDALDAPLDAPYDVVAAAESLLEQHAEEPRRGRRPATTEPAATAEQAAPAPETQPDLPPASQDDHDGLTILSSDLAAIREQLPSWASDEVPGPFRAPAPAEPAKLVLSTGLVVSLDRAVLLGRAPQVARVTNRELPRLVTVPSPQQDISRTHAEVRVEGDHVLVTDLDSTNGVHVSRAGEGSRRLHPGEPSVVATDEVVDLGDGVTFTVERGS